MLRVFDRFKNPVFDLHFGEHFQIFDCFSGEEIPWNPKLFAEIVRLLPEDINVFDLFRGKFTQEEITEAIYFFHPWYAKPFIQNKVENGEKGDKYYFPDPLGRKNVHFWIKGKIRSDEEWEKFEFKNAELVATKRKGDQFFYYMEEL